MRRKTEDNSLSKYKQASEIDENTNGIDLIATSLCASACVISNFCEVCVRIKNTYLDNGPNSWRKSQTEDIHVVPLGFLNVQIVVQ